MELSPTVSRWKAAVDTEFARSDDREVRYLPGPKRVIGARVVLVSGLAALVAGCPADPPVDVNPFRGLDGIPTLGRGFSVLCPPGFDLVTSAPKVTMSEAGMIRSPMHLAVWRSENAPEFDAPRTHRLGQARAYFVLEEHEGGSGGPNHVLRAYRSFPGGVIELQAEAQREFGPPDFGIAWTVLGSAALED